MRAHAVSMRGSSALKLFHGVSFLQYLASVLRAPAKLRGAPRASVLRVPVCRGTANARRGRVLAQVRDSERMYMHYITANANNLRR